MQRFATRTPSVLYFQARDHVHEMSVGGSQDDPLPLELMHAVEAALALVSPVRRG